MMTKVAMMILDFVMMTKVAMMILDFVMMTNVAKMILDFVMMTKVAMMILDFVMMSDEREGWFRCELKVMSCRKVPYPSLQSAQKGGVSDLGNWGEEPQEFAYECTIRLMTGRTHQVRISK